MSGMPSRGRLTIFVSLLALILVGLWLLAGGAESQKEGRESHAPVDESKDGRAKVNAVDGSTPHLEARAQRPDSPGPHPGVAATHPTASVRGVVRTAGGAVLPGASVAAGGVSTTTDPKGLFVIEVAEADFAPDLAIEARREGYRTQRRRIQPSQTTNVKFVLELSARIRGLVIDQDRKPVPGARVTLRRRGGDMSRTQTSSAGEFSFKNGTSGAWLLGVIPPEPRWRWRGPGEVVIEGRESPVTITIVRVPPGSATLLALLSEEGSELQSEPRQVMLYRLDRVAGPGEAPALRKAIWKPDGTVRAAGLEAGLWRLRVVTGGGHVARRDFTVATETEEVRLDIASGPPGGIAGEFTFEGQRRPAKVYVRLLGCREARWLQAGQEPVPGGAGSLVESQAARFRFDHVPADQALVLQVRGGGLWAEANLEVKPGQEARVVVALEPAGKFHLTGDGPSPTSSIVVSFRREGSRTWSPGIVVNSLAGVKSLMQRQVAAGLLRWRARFRVSPVGEVITREGEATIRPGKTSTSVLEYPR